jgi:hypothetical protein
VASIRRFTGICTHPDHDEDARPATIEQPRRAAGHAGATRPAPRTSHWRTFCALSDRLLSVADHGPETSQRVTRGCPTMWHVRSPALITCHRVRRRTARPHDLSSSCFAPHSGHRLHVPAHLTRYSLLPRPLTPLPLSILPTTADRHRSTTHRAASPKGVPTLLGRCAKLA